MDKEKIEHICKKCIEHWGKEAQFNQLAEECCELAANVNRYRRGRIRFEDLIEESVDVMLMTFQMRYLDEEYFDKILEEKLDRIYRRMKEDQLGDDV